MFDWTWGRGTFSVGEEEATVTKNCNEALQSGEAGGNSHSGTIPYYVLVNGCEIPIEFLNEESYVTPPQRVMHYRRFSQPLAELTTTLNIQTSLLLRPLLLIHAILIPIIHMMIASLMVSEVIR
ncbi:uncharacterized protein LOC132295126 isoform X2 [Cornus florida]|uniref:uncharacterized protein LOC132295126 isoform X2 n=1 Tax=Cornus florida TaxID=4283 RepID=UPI00289EE145|nr:uncharacterized protein LOC132295126 isoform X2 [Cornus florida]